MASIGIDTLKQEINRDIKYNNQHSITGTILNKDMINMVDTLIASNEDLIAKVRADVDSIRRSIALDKESSAYTDLVGYNTQHPNAQLAISTVLDSTQGSYATKRIPTICVTNNGTVLLGGQSQADGTDFSASETIIARKTSSSEWSYSIVVPYNQNGYGKPMNPCLVCDKQGVSGVVGRIFLFWLTTNHSGGAGFFSPTANEDMFYSYSDDDGVTWSTSVSLKGLWKTSQYNLAVPTPSRGLQMKDGTICIPMCFNMNLSSPTTINVSSLRSGLLYYSPTKGEWILSSPTPNDGDNECELHENNGILYLLARNDTHSKKNCYYYDFNRDKWNEYEDYWQNDRVICQTASINFKYNNKEFFLRDFFDATTRSNLTLMLSTNSFNFAKILLVNSALTRGYSSICYNAGKLVMALEGTDYTIQYIDLTNALPWLESIYDDLVQPIES